MEVRGVKRKEERKGGRRSWKKGHECNKGKERRVLGVEGRKEGREKGKLE